MPYRTSTTDSKEDIVKNIKTITNLAMAGKMSFKQSLQKRIALIRANKAHIQQLIDVLRAKISISIERNKDFFRKNADEVLIISSGFKDFIKPIVAAYGIKDENIYANTLTYDEKGYINGFDENNPLSQQYGKVTLIRQLKLQGDVFVIGDGYNDYEIKQAGFATKFYAFTENIRREEVIVHADHVAPSFDEVLYINKLPMSISYPKNRIKVLLLENIHPQASSVFKNRRLYGRNKTHCFR